MRLTSSGFHERSGSDRHGCMTFVTIVVCVRNQTASEDQQRPQVARVEGTELYWPPGPTAVSAVFPDPGDQAPVVKSADTATLKVAALGHAGSRPAGGTRSRTGDCAFFRPGSPCCTPAQSPDGGCAGQFLTCPASEVLRECVTTPLLFTIIVGPLVEATTTAVSAWAACSAISAAWNCFCK